MARSNRTWWLRWLPSRKPTVTPEPIGATSSYVLAQMEARRRSPAWPELSGAGSPSNLPPSTVYRAAGCHRSGPGRFTA